MLDYTELEAMIETAMREAIVPGLAMGVIQDNALVYAKGFGVTSTDETAMPITPDTLFRIGSVTKPLTGTMIMRLVEYGKLDLDEPMTSATPWVKFGEPDIASEVTLRLLLSHTAGLPTALNYRGVHKGSLLAAYPFQILRDMKAIAPAGLVYHYSNPGINYAAYVAELSMAKPYEQLMRELIFTPLQMHRTTFDPLVAMTYPFSQSFMLDSDAKPIVKRPFIDNPSEYPCGFAMSTVRDMANFAILHMSEGRFNGVQLLHSESIAEMHRPHADLYMSDNRAYGLTFRSRDYMGVRVVYHYGAIAKYRAVLVIVPERKVGVIMLANRGPSFVSAMDKLVDFVLDGLLGFEKDGRDKPSPLQSESVRSDEQGQPSPLQSEPFRAAPGYYTGAYLGPSAGLVMVEAGTDGITVQMNGGEIVSLQSVDGKCFVGRKASGARLSAGFPNENGMYLMVDGMLCFRYNYEPFLPDMAAWERKYAGVYSGDTDIWTVRFENGTIYIYSDDERYEVPCIPLTETRFASSFGEFQFVGDFKGKSLALVGGGGDWRFERLGVVF